MKLFWEGAEDELNQLEKSIGSAVNKAKNYYDARLQLRDAKEVLTKAKHRFERAQALHVAAKEMAVLSVKIRVRFFSSNSTRRFQADLIDEAEKSNQNAATWNENYRHALAKVNRENRSQLSHSTGSLGERCREGEVSSRFGATTSGRKLFHVGKIGGEITKRLPPCNKQIAVKHRDDRFRFF